MVPAMYLGICILMVQRVVLVLQCILRVEVIIGSQVLTLEIVISMLCCFWHFIIIYFWFRQFVSFYFTFQFHVHFTLILLFFVVLVQATKSFIFIYVLVFSFVVFCSQKSYLTKFKLALFICLAIIKLTMLLLWYTIYHVNLWA